MSSTRGEAGVTCASGCESGGVSGQLKATCACGSPDRQEVVGPGQADPARECFGLAPTSPSQRSSSATIAAL